MYDRVIGIDPGLSGGVALVKDGALAAVWPMPIAKGAREDGKDCVDAAALFALLGQTLGLSPGMHADRAVVIERIGIRPGQSAQTLVTAGRNYGAVEGALQLLGPRLIYATPQQWHKALGVPKFDKGTTATQKKAVTRAVAQRLLPGPVLDRIPASKDGLWEAALVGLYGYRTGRP